MKKKSNTNSSFLFFLLLISIHFFLLKTILQRCVQQNAEQKTGVVVLLNRLKSVKWLIINHQPKFKTVQSICGTAGQVECGQSMNLEKTERKQFFASVWKCKNYKLCRDICYIFCDILEKQSNRKYTSVLTNLHMQSHLREWHWWTGWSGCSQDWQETPGC